MAPCAELIFMRGPQRGKRITLGKQQIVAGRLHTCELVLEEQYASRRHFQLELLADGWVLQNISDNGTLVNGKRFKKNKQILLDTGDVLGVGTETEVLFVAPGDDAQAAINAYASFQPEDQAPQKPDAQVHDFKQEADEPRHEGEKPANASRYRKYMIFGGVYAVMIIALIVLLGSLKKSRDPHAGQPRQFSNYDISMAVHEPVIRHQNVNLAAEQLRLARALFSRRNFRTGDLQKCVLAFKLHLAYQNATDFADPDMQSLYIQARDELVTRVQELYTQAWMSQQARKWDEAVLRWEMLRNTLPRSSEDWDTRTYVDLQNNIMAHIRFVRGKLPKKR